MRTNHKLKGFTLVEILVVLAVVVVLGVLLFPVFSRVREKARSATCQSHLKQIALMVHHYAQDNDGRYPPYAGSGIMPDAYDTISEYRSQGLYVCPNAPHDVRQNEEYLHGEYTYNMGRLTTTAEVRVGLGEVRGYQVGREESRFVSPATIWLHSDSVSVYPSDLYGLLPRYSREVSPENQTSCRVTTWHSGGANFSFLDGHVKWFTPEAACDVENASYLEGRK